MSSVITRAHGEYLQAPGLLLTLGARSRRMGQRALILLSPNGRTRFGQLIEKSCTQAGCEYELLEFRGESSVREIDRITETAKTFDHIVAVGGGKAMDTAKAAAHESNRPLILVPTTPSSPAALTHLVGIHSDQHAFIGFGEIPECPQVVLSDTSILAAAPPRLLAAGIGSALASAQAALGKLHADVPAGAAPLATASLCWDRALQGGRFAALAARTHASVPALDDLFETNLCLAGIALDARGPGPAQIIGNALTHVRSHGRLHSGERDAFGLLVQLILEDADEEDIHNMIDFYYALGLPVTFAELGFERMSSEELSTVAKQASSHEVFSSFGIHGLTMIEQALRMADAAGQFFSDNP